MRDDLMGGALATAVAAPVLIACCGGGGILLAGFVGAIGGWLTGLTGISVLLAAAAVALTWRTMHRTGKSGDCCVQPGHLEVAQDGGRL
ncbi:hypothetical protein [Oceaniradius stylonematis]|jgi:hypothetical protein|uniref:hypothetical protein n=1 Tax=Oceaniradius stylonematis TaxID=2184161 RepID=UPI0035D07F4D